MKIIFFGNTKYSLIGAKIIQEKFGLSYIITIPDREDKRGRLNPSPLKTFALEQNIPVLTVNKLDEETINQLASLQPDFLIVEDYGLILPQKLLDLPKYDSLNIHHSLLPKYRGPAPAPFALLAGEKISGVSIIHMTNKVDAGDIYAQKEYVLNPEETTDSLLTRLNTLGGELVVQVIDDIIHGEATRSPQNEQEATATHYMKKADGYIDTENPPGKEQLDRMIRAYFPWPTVWTRLTINELEKIVKFLPEKMIQVEGKKAVTMKDFLNGYPELKTVIETLLT